MARAMIRVVVIKVIMAVIMALLREDTAIKIASGIALLFPTNPTRPWGRNEVCGIRDPHLIDYR
jgi:hypothetical protein